MQEGIAWPGELSGCGWSPGSLRPQAIPPKPGLLPSLRVWGGASEGDREGPSLPLPGKETVSPVEFGADE